MPLNSCPCCGSQLLRHARQQGIYWFCTSCRQEMTPLFDEHLRHREVLIVRPRLRQTVNS